MSYMFYLYHPENAPDGALFEQDTELNAYSFSVSMAERGGWVDSPAKFGQKNVDPIDKPDINMTEKDLQKEISKAKAAKEAAEAVEKSIRTEESPARKRADKKEEMMERKNDHGILKEQAKNKRRGTKQRTDDSDKVKKELAEEEEKRLDEGGDDTDL